MVNLIAALIKAQQKNLNPPKEKKIETPQLEIPTPAPKPKKNTKYWWNLR